MYSCHSILEMLQPVFWSQAEYKIILFYIQLGDNILRESHVTTDLTESTFSNGLTVKIFSLDVGKLF